MKNHNLKRRLFDAAEATSLGPALTAVIQLTPGVIRSEVGD
jgi:hypothetical protein